VRTLAIANAKGGTGKTTLAVHLAVGLARRGRRVLLVDLDPQGSASTWLLGLDHGIGGGVAEALLARRIGPDHAHLVPGYEKRLMILPATPGLEVAKDQIASRPVAHLTLRRALRDVAASYDDVVLDCPPAVGFLTVSALCAADAVLAPVLAAYLSLAGLRRLGELVAEVREGLESTVQVLGHVLFAADPREAITQEARATLQGATGAKLLRSEVRISTAAKSLPARRMTAWDDGADERGREDYPRLLREVAANLGALEEDLDGIAEEGGTNGRRGPRRTSAAG
jgi:chromosome partitioning protein